MSEDAPRWILLPRSIRIHDLLDLEKGVQRLEALLAAGIEVHIRTDGWDGSGQVVMELSSSWFDPSLPDYPITEWEPGEFMDSYIPACDTFADVLDWLFVDQVADAQAAHSRRSEALQAWADKRNRRPDEPERRS